MTAATTSSPNTSSHRPKGLLEVTKRLWRVLVEESTWTDDRSFLLARIREFWLASRRTRADIDESVALGLARTGRVVTAAALIMSISFGGLVAAQVSFMRMFGLGLALAVLVNATLVLMILLCAVPFGRDQFEVARRVEIARCGTRLPARRLTPSRLRRKVLSAMKTTVAPSRLPTVSKRPGASRTARTLSSSTCDLNDPLREALTRSLLQTRNRLLLKVSYRAVDDCLSASDAVRDVNRVLGVWPIPGVAHA